MKKTELIVATLSILALALNLLLIPGGGVLTVLTLSTLSMLYFCLGFALFNAIGWSEISNEHGYKGISKLRIVGAIGAGFALSTTTVGLMFKFQSWPGADFNLIVGLVGLLIVVIIGLIKYAKNKSDYYTGIFKRAAVFGGLGLVLLLTPKASWMELKYRKHPAYVEAMKKAMIDPENKELWDKVEVERQKMNDEREQE
jgi:hypothetical protein